jgi:hypothetical protein
MLRATLLLVVSALVLTGCTPPAEETAPSASSSASVTPTPTPTVEAPAVKPTLARLVLSPEGLGPIVIGEPIAVEPVDVAVAVFDDTFCDFGDSSDHGGWKPNYDLTADGHWPFLPEGAAVVTDPVTSITVQSNEIRTAQGLGLGSTNAQLAAQYGDIAPVESFGYLGYSVPGTRGQLVFWFDGSTDAVSNIEVIEPGLTPAFRFEIGGCA